MLGLVCAKCRKPLESEKVTEVLSWLVIPCSCGSRLFEMESDEMAEDEKRKEMVHHPEHYGGKDNPYEAIKVIEAWGLGFCLGNAVKYICRFGKKDDRRAPVEDLKKARWYLDREIQRREADENNQANRKSD